MPHTEFINWCKFFRERPPGWQEDQRTFLMMKSFGYKGKAESLFPSLKQIKREQEKKQEPDRAVPKGKFLEKMLKATGGDGSGWSPIGGIDGK